MMPDKQLNPYQVTGHSIATAKAASPVRYFLILNVILISFLAGLWVIASFIPSLTFTNSGADANGNLVVSQTTITLTTGFWMVGIIGAGLTLGLANAALFFYLWLSRLSNEPSRNRPPSSKT